ncbi:MAG: hypothetical protein QM820_61175 [Minicystis sp.]
MPAAPPPPVPPPAEIAARLRAEAAGARLLVGPGQFTPHPGRPRVVVLRLHDTRGPEVLWDGFLLQTDLAPLRDALAAFATVWPGELDMMFATPWHVAWTVPPAPARVYDNEGLAAAVDGHRITICSAGRVQRALEAAAVARVLGWASGDRVERGVDLVLHGGERVTVAVRHDLAVPGDPAYDAIDLELDAAWIPGAGKSLAGAIHVPYEAADPALR